MILVSVIRDADPHDFAPNQLFCVRQLNICIDEELITANNPVAWFEIYLDEMERAKKFYETVLAISLEKLNDPTDSGIVVWSFPFDMEKYGTTGALV